MRRIGFLLIVVSAVLMAVAVAPASPPALSVTHGPTLGRLGSDQVAIWLRTSKPTAFVVRYGPSPDPLNEESVPVETLLEHDNTGWVLLDGLVPAKQYAYSVFLKEGERTIEGPGGQFRTLPDRESYRDPDVNPQGLFNFSFEFSCGNRQPVGATGAVPQPVYDTMLREIVDKVDFSILNGDWLYEERRDFKPEQWMQDTGVSERDVPHLLRVVPGLAGVWENYKLYLDRGKSLSDWQRLVPSFFVLDDHELLDDIRGTDSPGYREHRAVYRDIGVHAWYDYLGWANPVSFSQGVLFGQGEFEAGSAMLKDSAADFRNLDLAQAATLHVHWGGPTAWRKEKRYDHQGGDVNAGVYEIVDVVDAHTLQISPAARAEGKAPYSVGRRNYFRMTIANCEFFVLDTRSHRGLPAQMETAPPGQSMLGSVQKQWLKEEMRTSSADFLFVVSSVNFLVPHLLDVGEEQGPDTWVGQHDSWTGFPEERQEMLRFWDSLGKPVLLLTGDLHASFVARIKENVWEIASGAHTSGNAKAASGGDYPASGHFEYQGMSGEIRWSTHRRDDSAGYNQPTYCVVQANNVQRSPARGNPQRWAAFPKPQLVFTFYDGLSGDLLFSEAVVAR